jgi:hypothetical protein
MEEWYIRLACSTHHRALLKIRYTYTYILTLSILLLPKWALLIGWPGSCDLQYSRPWPTLNAFKSLINVRSPSKECLPLVAFTISLLQPYMNDDICLASFSLRMVETNVDSLSGQVAFHTTQGW